LTWGPQHFMKLFGAKTFRKVYQRLKISDNQYAKYIIYLSLLLEGKALPLEAWKVPTGSIITK